nr:g-type lectin s-receptor-like serine/threonine-protein kinase [Quercus suber]
MISALSLSWEEQEELARNNKKVKNVCHVDFREGLESSLPSNGHGQWSGMSSFKDKLVGEIPSAYKQAFSFGDIMEDDEGSDEEVETLWKGRLVSTFSTIGFFHCGNLREDYGAVLRKGPWFIGEHFLSIRPWEPDFRLPLANVTSIAVWVRLNELPIEYYNAEALLHIGKTIGKVLRVDTHTASEARGRFARICVQIDVDKPLVKAVLIGRFEQPICYDGIQKLCFDCGRMGHCKENCPYTVRQNISLREGSTMDASEKGGRSCEERGTSSERTGEGPSGAVHESGQECVQEDTSPRALDVVSVSFGAGHDLANNKPNQKGPVKGKKALVRAKASQDSCLGAVEGEHYISSSADQVNKRSARGADEQVPYGGDRKLVRDEGSALSSSLEFQIINTPRPKLGFTFRGDGNDDTSSGVSRDSCHTVLGHGVDKQRASKSMEVDSPVDKGESKGDRAAGHGYSVHRGNKSFVGFSNGCVDGGMAGKALAACSNSDAVVLGSVKVGFSLGSVSDAEVTHGRGYRDSRSTGVMVGSSTMAEIEASSLTVVSPILGRLVLDELGILERSMWHKSKWIGFWSAPKESCDKYLECGPNSYCDPYNADKFECICLPRFEPKSTHDWYLRDGSGGCVRNGGVSMCRSGEGFVKLARVKVPDTSIARTNMSLSLKECEQECLRNCSCMAYTSPDERSDGIGCLSWYGEFVDTRTYSKDGQDLYLRVDAAVLGTF